MLVAARDEVGQATAAADPKTDGTITGTLIEKASKQPAVGATVVMTSPALTGEQVVISDEKGFYSSPVPAGTYALTIYYNNKSFSRTNIVVKSGAKVPVNVTLDVPSPDKGEVITIEATPGPTYTITGDGITITAKDDYKVTLLEKGKKPVIVNTFNDDVELDGKILGKMGKVSGSDDVTVTVNGKLVATLTQGGQAKLPGKAKPIYFDAKGELVNASRKLKITPVAMGKRIEMMAVLVTLLRDKL